MAGARMAASMATAATAAELRAGATGLVAVVALAETVGRNPQLTKRGLDRNCIPIGSN